jgi:translation initiation factor 4E
MARLSNLPNDSGFHLFQEGVKPMWEDENNKNGGRFILRLKKQYANYFWENLLIAFIGEQCELANSVMGLQSSCKENEVI